MINEVIFYFIERYLGLRSKKISKINKMNYNKCYSKN